MGTKTNPGKYDCYANAEPDEPMFLLLARDLSAPFLTEAWAFIRSGNRIEATRLVNEAIDCILEARKETSNEQLAEALECADQMTDWRFKNRGQKT